jgi:hypothetical protein
MSANLHDKDFHAWTIQQAHLLKDGKLHELDLDNLIEEIESMGASERNQLQNRLKVLIGHLLKWQFQPAYRTRSWNATIKEQRLSVIGLIEDNPSLKSILAERIAKAYPQGVYLAVKETNLDEKTFPSICPYSIDQLFDMGFFPGDCT